MKCLHCEGRMKRAAAPFHIDHKATVCHWTPSLPGCVANAANLISRSEKSRPSSDGFPSWTGKRRVLPRWLECE